jgi:membrane protease YdiL (CAAX protease family)
MLFLAKRNVSSALAGLLVCALFGVGLRAALPDPPPIELSFETVQLGVVVVGLVLCSDALIHGALLLLFGEKYRRLHRELADVFSGQTYVAMFAGALMAGAGEELVFRGLSTHPAYLGGSAVVFGLLHHIRRELWPFTLWSIGQGVLFGIAVGLTGVLGVTMVAHFLHDLSGFLLFRYLRWAQRRGAA